MRTCIILFFLLFSIHLNAQKSFTLHQPNVREIHTLIQESEGTKGAISIYLEQHYNKNSKRIHTKREPDGKTACGFTEKFEFEILYSKEQCEEAALLTEKIIFPKIKMTTAKKWVEYIYKAGITKIENIWYGDTNEYGPVDREAGCYYRIKQTKDKTTISVSCGS